MRINLITPHLLGKEKEYVNDAIKSNWIAPLGPYVKELENNISKYIKTKYSVATSSGTSAIHLALKAIGIKEGDIVLCPDMTFIATENPILYEKAIPVFIDCEEETGGMDPEALKKAFEKYTPKAVIVVHLYGTICKIDEIKEICDFHKVALIEDGAESLGSTYKNKHASTFGDIGCISFNGNKIITTGGGGMTTTNNKEYADKIFSYATQSRISNIYYEHGDIGYNYRLSNISASIGVGQLEKIEEKVKMKQEINKLYKEGFKDCKNIKVFDYCVDRKNNNWISCIRVKGIDTKKIYKKLLENDIESRFFWLPLHKQKPNLNYDLVCVDNERIVSDILFNECLCLPSDTNMTREEQKEVIEIVKESCKC